MTEGTRGPQGDSEGSRLVGRRSRLIGRTSVDSNHKVQKHGIRANHSDPHPELSDGDEPDAMHHLNCNKGLDHAYSRLQSMIKV